MIKDEDDLYPNITSKLKLIQYVLPLVLGVSFFCIGDYRHNKKSHYVDHVAPFPYRELANGKIIRMV